VNTVYASQDLLLLNHLKHLLEQEGIDCLLEQVHLQGAMGELPLTAWPRLVVLDPDKKDEAQTVLKRALDSTTKPVGMRICGACGEPSESQFTDCWNCGAALPSKGSLKVRG